MLRVHPRAATFAALVGLAAISTALRAIIVGHVHGPLVFMDELGYERMAQSFAHTGHFSLFGKTGLAYSPLYPIVLSPRLRADFVAADGLRVGQGREHGAHLAFGLPRLRDRAVRAAARSRTGCCRPVAARAADALQRLRDE